MKSNNETQVKDGLSMLYVKEYTHQALSRTDEVDISFKINIMQLNIKCYIIKVMKNEKNTLTHLNTVWKFLMRLYSYMRKIIFSS